MIQRRYCGKHGKELRANVAGETMHSHSSSLVSSLEGAHDLKCLPLWGPYSKRYMGCSHIPKLESGFRFDFSVMPGLHRRKIEVPNIGWECGYFPLAASPDLRFHSHRHPVSGDGASYCDVEFYNLSESSTAFRCRLRNGASWTENFSLSLFAWLNFPQMRDYDTTPVRPAVPRLPEGSLWLAAMRYASISFAKPNHLECLSPDGRPHGQVREHGLSGGEGCSFGVNDGDRLDYSFPFAGSLDGMRLLLRYKLPSGARGSLSLGSAVLELSGDGSFATASVPAASALSQDGRLSVSKLSGSKILLDGFALVPSASEASVRFDLHDWNPVPEIERVGANAMILKYADLDLHYGLAWDSAGFNFMSREYFCKDLDLVARRSLNDMLSLKIRGEGEGHFANVLLSPVFLGPSSSLDLCGLLCCGSRDEVKSSLESFDPASPSLRSEMARLRDGSFKNICSKAGAKHQRSQDFMAALTLSQVVYPVNTAGTMIRHSPPGRWWDCLYTWDSGFIGLGLSALDIERAVWNLNAYMSQGEPYVAFLHHGTPLPVQHYLFMEIWSRTRSMPLLRHFYPKLLKFYLFLAGRLPGSNSRNLKSQLIRTWDYFYNSGGWDDYPPQVHVHDKKLEASVVPAVSSSHLIRVAKFLRMLAIKLREPCGIFDEDVAVLSESLRRNSWDPESGYFSYVMHDASGQPCGPLRHSSGANYNMGMDGASPLVAGACDSEQEKALVANLMGKGRMWTDYGISTVDLRAPYYSHSGYWNGAVWMPHQWFFWKAMLDLGLGDEAFKIADTALNLWSEETARTNSAFEHFSVSGGRGSGWHHFSGLSCPVLNWFAAYFRPGEFTAGFDVFVEDLLFDSETAVMKASLLNYSTRDGLSTCVACMNPDYVYDAWLDGSPGDFKLRLPGVLEIALPPGGLAPKPLNLEIKAKGR